MYKLAGIPILVLSLCINAQEIPDYSGEYTFTVNYSDVDDDLDAAIFSEKSVYECQVQRLMKKIDQLATIYQDKIIITSREGQFTRSWTS